MPDTARIEQLLSRIAAHQHGVVTRQQMKGGRVTDEMLRHRLRIGRLRRLHRGVYLVGPLTSPHTHEMAAALACGEGAHVSARSAARLWEIGTGPPISGGVDITTTIGRGGHRPGICVRHMPSLRADETTVLRAIPITTPARTLLDLACLTASRDLERALASALTQRLTATEEIAALLDRHTREPGAKRLRSLLDNPDRVAFTRSAAEERFLALLRKGGLGAPLVNTRMAGLEVDFAWPEQRLVIEIDGVAYHSSAQQFERDRARDAILVAAGLSVFRVTWKQLVHQPERVLVLVTRALAHSGRVASR